MSNQPRVLRLLSITMSCHMELDTRHNGCKQEQRQEDFHTHFASYSLPKTWHLKVGIRNEEDPMRTSFNALLTADTGIGILERCVLVPQKSYLANHILRTLLHTPPASHTMAWIHRDKLSQKFLHIYLLFLATMIMQTSGMKACFQIPECS